MKTKFKKIRKFLKSASSNELKIKLNEAYELWYDTSKGVCYD